MMLTVASGANTEILFTSSSVRNLFSILMMAFFPIFLEERFVAIETRLGCWLNRRISATLKTVSGVMWSMTVPSSIFETLWSLSTRATSGLCACLGGMVFFEEE